MSLRFSRRQFGIASLAIGSTGLSAAVFGQGNKRYAPGDSGVGDSNRADGG